MPDEPETRTIQGLGEPHRLIARGEISDDVLRNIILQLEADGKLPQRTVAQNGMTLSLGMADYRVDVSGMAYEVLVIPGAIMVEYYEEVEAG